MSDLTNTAGPSNQATETDAAKSKGPSGTVTALKATGARLAALGNIMQRALLSSRAGLQFGGDRDLYQVFGYKKRLTFEDFLAKYLRQDIAKRVIEAPVSATWKNPPAVKGSTEFNAAWEAVTKLPGVTVWRALARADRMASLGQYAILMVGLDDSTSPDVPVTEGNADNLLYLQPYSQVSVSIPDLVTDTTDPRFGMPLVYDIRPTATESISAGIQGTSSVATRIVDLKVHHTRVLHVADTDLEDNVLGTPRLIAIFNLLDDLLKVAGGTAETFWLSGRQGLQVDIDKEMDLGVDDAKALADELDEYMHQLRRVIRTKGVDITNIGSDVPNPKGAFDMLISMIAGTTGIPRRILMGSEIGQLASEQDRANWADRIGERQTSYAEPIIMRPFVDMLQFAGVLPESDYDIEWPDPFNLSPLEDGQMMAQKGRAAANLSKQLGGPVATQEESREIMGLPSEGGPPMPPSRIVQPGQPGEVTQPGEPNGNPVGAPGDTDDNNQGGEGGQGGPGGRV